MRHLQHEGILLDFSHMESPEIDFPTFEAGSVWLVGAGPGDPGLLPLLGYYALRTSDVVVYDALVGDEILKLVPPNTAIEYAGKRGGKPSPSQQDISGRLVELARAGKRVLRLKGGDPFMFGRGVEECTYLRGAEIPFRIVPGITAGLGGLAYAGIPLTSRGANTTVTFLTGVAAGGDVPEPIDWHALANASPVLVIYMGVTHLDKISDRLIEAGRAPDEPVAVVSRATLPDQTVVVTTLTECASEVAKVKPKPPNIVVVGPIVDLRNVIGWWNE